MPISKQLVQAKVEDLGLKLFGCVALSEEQTAFPRFLRWLEAGKHASMHFLTRYQDLRRDPRGLLEDGKQALILGLPYYQGDRLMQVKRGLGVIAQYARLKDYHRTLKQKGESLGQWLLTQADHPFSFRVTVDSAPILERALAARTSVGFIGKNTCFIHPREGSFFLLMELIVDQTLFAEDPPPELDSQARTAQGGCGTCKRCQVHCPTGALNTDYQLDARLCLAYWTIEHRGTIPFEFWRHLPHQVFGCDLCQLACPYNRELSPIQSESRQDFRAIDLYALAIMTQAEYEAKFGGTPVTRAKRSGLRRNALIALAVLRDPRLPAALALLEQEPEETMLLATREQIMLHFPSLNGLS